MLVPARALGLASAGLLVVPSRATLHVASTKPSKVEPARAWLARILGSGLLAVERHAVASGVPEQPIGVEAGERGARQRLAAMARDLAGPSVVVAIESTIVRLSLAGAAAELVDEDGLVAVDVAAVVIASYGAAPGDRATTAPLGGALAWSDGVAVPARFVDAARRASTIGALGWSVTVGAHIAHELSVPADDWHAALVGRTRGELIGAALETVQVSQFGAY